ncbi:hypothetical protein EJB05_24392 [Eragrostis curvula]|uniref:Uncharacterized protein n=1 Tax=Eragrostis curvula TaxID=38414 RepID=A0A5J9VAZ2_9POAL|nr:hypothetical protein EJB05_24392 [Eragrostis curvula]
MAHTSALASLLPLLLMVLLATCAQTDGSEFVIPILRHKPLTPPTPEDPPHPPCTPSSGCSNAGLSLRAKVPNVINIGACQNDNEGDGHAGKRGAPNRSSKNTSRGRGAHLEQGFLDLEVEDSGTAAHGRRNGDGEGFRDWRLREGELRDGSMSSALRRGPRGEQRRGPGSRARGRLDELGAAARSGKLSSAHELREEGGGEVQEAELGKGTTRSGCELGDGSTSSAPRRGPGRRARGRQLEDGSSGTAARREGTADLGACRAAARRAAACRAAARRAAARNFASLTASCAKSTGFRV